MIDSADALITEAPSVRLACVWLLSLTTATAAPSATAPTLPSMVVTLTFSLKTALTATLPPAHNVPPAAAVTLSAMLTTAIAAPVPNAPPETWPAMIVIASISLALTAMSPVLAVIVAPA